MKDAAQQALAHAQLLYGVNLRGLRVEELVPSDDDEGWIVTVGWVEPDYRALSASGLGYATGSVEALPRVYKVLHLEPEHGDLISVKMRE